MDMCGGSELIAVVFGARRYWRVLQNQMRGHWDYRDTHQCTADIEVSGFERKQRDDYAWYSGIAI